MSFRSGLRNESPHRNSLSSPRTHQIAREKERFSWAFSFLRALQRQIVETTVATGVGLQDGTTQAHHGGGK